MKKIIFIIIMLILSINIFAQNASYKRLSVDTIKSLSSDKKVDLKDTFNIITALKIPTGAGLNKFAISNAYGVISWSNTNNDSIPWIYNDDRNVIYTRYSPVKVGIGLEDPASMLQVQGQIISSDASTSSPIYPSIGISQETNYGQIITYSNKPLVIQPALSTLNHVGIGVNNPKQKLSVGGSFSATDSIILNKKIVGTSDTILIRSNGVIECKSLSASIHDSLELLRDSIFWSRNNTYNIIKPKNISDKLFIGSTASRTDFPSTMGISSQGNTGYNSTNPTGFAAEALCTSSQSDGVIGIASVNGTIYSAQGITGVGKVGNTNDLGSAIGVCGKSESTHIGGVNYGLVGSAFGGLRNFALSMNNGNIESVFPQSWLLSYDSDSALSFDSYDKNNIISISSKINHENIVINRRAIFNDTIILNKKISSTSDSCLIRENNIIKYRISQKFDSTLFLNACHNKLRTDTVEACSSLLLRAGNDDKLLLTDGLSPDTLYGCLYSDSLKINTDTASTIYKSNFVIKQSRIRQAGRLGFFYQQPITNTNNESIFIGSGGNLCMPGKFFGSNNYGTGLVIGDRIIVSHPFGYTYVTQNGVGSIWSNHHQYLATNNSNLSNKIVEWDSLGNWKHTGNLKISTIIASSDSLLYKPLWIRLSDSSIVRSNANFAPTINGTINYIPKFTATKSIGNSIIYDDGNKIGIGIIPTQLLHIYGAAPTLLVQSNASSGANASSYIGVTTLNGLGVEGFKFYYDGAATGNTFFDNYYSVGDMVFRTKVAGTAAEAMRIKYTGNIGIGVSSPTNILSFSGNAARTIWMERHTTTNTSGNNFTIQAGGSTLNSTDKDGGLLILSPGLSTGTGKSSIRLQRISRAASTGTTDNTLVDAMILPSTKPLTNNSPINLFEVAIGTDISTGGIIQFSVSVMDVTNHKVQTYCGIVKYEAHNENGSIAGTITEESNPVTYLSGGTLATTWAITAGSGKVTISLNANSSLAAISTENVNYIIQNLSNSNVTPL